MIEFDSKGLVKGIRGRYDMVQVVVGVRLLCCWLAGSMGLETTVLLATVERILGIDRLSVPIDDDEYVNC